ncbi:MAG: hypothetical protein GTO41_11035 [Burkholderiales bacterium]|nr:hypothetical protein [Burkholderiales bacterium]
MNAHNEEVTCTLRSLPAGSQWELLIDTSREEAIKDGMFFDSEHPYPVKPHSFVLLVQRQQRASVRDKG